MVQGVNNRPAVYIDGEELEAVDHFTYLGSTANDKLSLDQEINIGIGKTATEMIRLTKKSLEDRKLTVKKKALVYKVQVLSILRNGSEILSTYSHQDKWLRKYFLLDH